tara:strand:+ start:1426 stop:3006 length:1581 start_codon:yes stop_codon:yes gene_type:complete
MPDVRELKLLNLRRWQAHVDALGTGVDPVEREAPTAGALFNRSNPRNLGKFVKPYNRQTDKQEPMRGHQTWVSPRDYRRVDQPGNPKDWQSTRQAVPQQGQDFTSVGVTSVHKYRIPVTSVTRKEGDIKLFLCCGWRLTAAQWIWMLNLLCFLAHSLMIYATLYFAYFRHDRNWLTETEHLMIPIYRIRTVPTQYMLDNNLSKWSDGWNNSLTSDEPNSGLFLYDNAMPINFASLIIAFFATSALFHFWALVFGLFERFWFYYWRQMDDAFCYWRWAEYSISASIMSIALAITLGIREQNTLAGLFMLTWSCQAFGFLVEYISVPKALVDTVNHKYPIGPLQMEKFADRNNNDYGKTDYYQDPHALKLISQTEWDLDRPLYDVANTTRPVAVQRMGYFVRAQRTRNYVRRMVPHIFGWFPMTSVWYILINQLEQAKRDVAEVTDREIPSWVNAVIYGTALIFMSFAFVQITFQRLAPGFYWGTEVCYCILSLTAKMYLGWFLLINVLYVDGSTADETLQGGNVDVR